MLSVVLYAYWRWFLSSREERTLSVNCSMAEVYQPFRGSCPSHLETNHYTTRHYNPEDSSLTRHCQNLKSHLVLCVVSEILVPESWVLKSLVINVPCRKQGHREIDSRGSYPTHSKCVYSHVYLIVLYHPDHSSCSPVLHYRSSAAISRETEVRPAMMREVLCIRCLIIWVKPVLTL